MQRKGPGIRSRARLLLDACRRRAGARSHLARRLCADAFRGHHWPAGGGVIREILKVDADRHDSSLVSACEENFRLKKGLKSDFPQNRGRPEVPVEEGQ